MTTEPVTSGEAAKPHIGTFRPATVLRSCFQTISPVAGFSRRNVPVAPVTNNPPLARVGVARGPGPPSGVVKAGFDLPIPDFPARVGVVTDHRFHGATLLLREEQISRDGEGRPSRARLGFSTVASGAARPSSSRFVGRANASLDPGRGIRAIRDGKGPDGSCPNPGDRVGRWFSERRATTLPAIATSANEGRGRNPRSCLRYGEGL